MYTEDARRNNRQLARRTIQGSARVPVQKITAMRSIQLGTAPSMQQTSNRTHQLLPAYSQVSMEAW